MTNARSFVKIIACVVGVCVDPFFFYIPFLSLSKQCLGIDTNLWKVAVVVRSVADLAYLFGYFSFAFGMVFKRSISIKLISLAFLYCLSCSPAPQVFFYKKFILKNLRQNKFGTALLFVQYGVRLVLIFQACEELKTRVSVKTLIRFNAVVYLFLYLIVSHVIGASWYYLSIKRQVSCWKDACKIGIGCVNSIFRCDGTTTSTLNSTIVNEFCPINPPNATIFNYGIYLDALQSRIFEEKGVLKKFLQCFFWGLRNLSSFASNLQTSTNDGETVFAIIIFVVGLILLIYIIGNIQRYAELASARSERIVDKMKLIEPKINCLVKNHNLSEYTRKMIKEHIQKALKDDNNSFYFERFGIHPLLTDDTITESLFEDLHILETSVLNPRLDIQGNAEKWLSNNKISSDQNNILFYLTCRLEDDEDVNLKSVLSVLPYKHEWMTKKDLCFDALKKVPGLQNIDEEWFRIMSSNLEPVVYPKESYIFREGEPLDFIIFITNGIAWCYTTSTNAGGISVSNNFLQKGDFFGEQLIEWKLDKIRELESDRMPLSCIPISTANVKSHTQVEALVLMAKDLALCSEFFVPTLKFKHQMILNAFLHKRIADSVTEGVDSSSRTVEVTSVQREIEEV